MWATAWLLANDVGWCKWLCTGIPGVSLYIQISSYKGTSQFGLGLNPNGLILT